LWTASEQSAAKPSVVNDFTALLVLRGSWRKSATFSFASNDFSCSLVLRSAEQDSTQVAEEISPDDPERILGEIPRQGRQRWREHQRRDDGLRVLRLQPTALQAMSGEVIGITSTPRGLRLGAPRDLTDRC
jgi:hypothetical protein